MAAKHKVHLQHVGVATMPEDYEFRLKEMFSRPFQEVEDSRTEFLRFRFVKTVPLDAKVLQHRYDRELRPNLMARESWHDGTLKMWIGSYFSPGTPSS